MVVVIVQRDDAVLQTEITHLLETEGTIDHAGPKRMTIHRLAFVDILDFLEHS